MINQTCTLHPLEQHTVKGIVGASCTANQELPLKTSDHPRSPPPVQTIPVVSRVRPAHTGEAKFAQQTQIRARLLSLLEIVPSFRNLPHAMGLKPRAVASHIGWLRKAGYIHPAENALTEKGRATVASLGKREASHRQSKRQPRACC